MAFTLRLEFYDEVILMSEKNQVDFMFDFEGNKVMLDQLQANPYLSARLEAKIS